MDMIGSGTMAKAYKVGDKVIKVTRDNKDVINTVKAQRIKSPNIVKIHRLSKDGLSSGTAMLVDYIPGKLAPFSTGEWHAMIQGDVGMDELREAANKIVSDTNPKGIRTKILSKHGLNDVKERNKLREVFKTLSSLQSININVDDLGDNIIDDGNKYVIIDLGN
ncbi:hypothetical protein CCP1ISM_3470003 [Azospirillaceae bacterium]